MADQNANINEMLHDIVHTYLEICDVTDYESGLTIQK